MQIRVSCCYDEELKQQLKEMALFVLPKLVKGRPLLLNNLKLYVKMDDKLTTKEDAWGLCYWKGNPYRPRAFSIYIRNSLSSIAIIQTYIHELVHVKQYLLGELSDYASGKIKWKKRIYEDLDDQWRDLSSPWEKEAYKISKSMYLKYYCPPTF
jgi:hypothetical protein